MLGFSDGFVGEWSSDYEGGINTNPGVYLYKIDRNVDRKEFDRVSGALSILSLLIYVAFMSGLDCTINEIELGVNPALTRMFFGSIDLIEKKEQHEEFQPKLQSESSSQERLRVLEQVSESVSKLTT